MTPIHSQSLHLLIVESSPTAADDFQRFIQPYLPPKSSYNATASIQQTIDFLRHNPVDLVIAHISLGQENGFALCKMLRALPEFQDLPIMLFGDHSSTRDKIMGFSSGADDFIVRPIDPRLLVSRMKLLLRIKGLEHR